MKRIHIHWTGGADGVNSVEADSYNFVIDRKGKVHEGTHPVSAQVPPLVAGKYAAHTLGANSYAIGVALDAMADAKEVPFNAGKYPLTQVQLDAAYDFIAKLCKQYGIPVTRETVLTHAEVERTLGIKQKNKWDIVWLPDMAKPADAIKVGDRIREEIRRRFR